MQRKRKSVIGVMLATAAAAVGLGIAAPSAQANSCPAGYLCAWTASGYTGTMGKVAGNNTNLLQYSVMANADSVYNNGTRCSVDVYAALNYQGASLFMDRGTGYTNLGTGPTLPWYHYLASDKWAC
jgi:hypothetical protein